VVRGVLGAYPNALFRVKAEELGTMASLLTQLKSEADYDAFRDRFGVRRTDPHFWEFSDLVHSEHQALGGLRAGRLDYSRLENR
jgi:hypothetical protein